MKMRAIKTIILFLTAVAVVPSCVKEKLEETYNKQEEQIDKYITTQLGQNADYSVEYNHGSSRLIRKAGDGPALESGGSVSFYYAGYAFNGNINQAGLFVTNHEETATNANWNLADPDYALLEINLKDGRLLEGVRNGLLGVKAGEECEILFSAKYGFGNSTFGIIPAKTALAFKIWVVGVSND